MPRDLKSRNRNLGVFVDSEEGAGDFRKLVLSQSPAIKIRHEDHCHYHRRHPDVLIAQIPLSLF